MATPDADLIGVRIRKRFIQQIFVGTIVFSSPRQSTEDDDVVLFKVGSLCSPSHYFFYFIYDVLRYIPIQYHISCGI